MKLAFITGITGQDGYYLTKLLLSKNYKIYGIVRRTSELYCSSRIHSLENDITLRYGDLTDKSALQSYINDIIKNHIDEFEILEIYNLAAQSHVGISFKLPNYTTEVDGVGVLNLLEIIKNCEKPIKNKIKFYQAGTSELYGKVLETPQSELTPFNPISPYAAAKQYAYQITKIYREAYNIFAVNGILFNHESPKRGPNFVTMKIINAIKDIVKGKREFVKLGNIYSKRDWGHAKDYVEAMWKILQQREPDDYVIATGKQYSVKQFINLVANELDMKIVWKGKGTKEKAYDKTSKKVIIECDKKYFRPLDVNTLLGDAKKARKKLNWEPKINIKELIRDMIDDEMSY